MKILFLSRWFPYPPSNGSKLRIYNLLRGLAARHEVTLISFADQPDVELDRVALQAVCSGVQVVPWVPFRPNSVRARLHLLNPKPRSMITTFSPAMEHRIRQCLAADQYDLVIASQIDAALYSRCFQHVPALFEEVEVGVLYERYAHAASPWAQFRQGLTWAKHRRYLRTLLERFRLCTVVSERERQLVSQAIASNRVPEVIPNCVDVASYADVHEKVKPNTLIFTGAFTYAPNYEGMCWFLGKVFPAIQAQLPDAHLTITGNHADRPIPQHPHITLTGFVDDVRPLVARSWASIVPLHRGGGTRLKILEAMALGTPVVATSKGAEGLDASHDIHLLIADTPEDMAQVIVRLFQDPALRQRLAQNAYQLVCEKYNWAAIMPRFLDLVELAATLQSFPPSENKVDGRILTHREL